MSRKRGLLMIILSLVMGVAVAADIAIPFGTTVAARHLKTLKMPAEFAPPGSFTSLDEVVGHVTVQPIVAGEILMRERFTDHETGSTLAALVSEKMRAVTVRVDDVIGVAGFLLPGNRVDVLAARTDMNRRATAETILRDIKVLAVDQTAATEKNEPVIVRAVTLEVDPTQAEALIKAKEEGSIQLTLRNPLDDEALATVEPEPAKPAPAPRVVTRRSDPPPRMITVIRGTDVSKSKDPS
jgi:pilus assembly protein CpaB